MRKKLIALKKPMVVMQEYGTACAAGTILVENKENGKSTYFLELKQSNGLTACWELKLPKGIIDKICKEIDRINRGIKTPGKYVTPAKYTDQKLLGEILHYIVLAAKPADAAIEITGLIEKLKKEEKDNGFELAVAIAEDYDSLSSHPNRVSDCIRAKANRLPKSKIRKNAK